MSRSLREIPVLAILLKFIAAFLVILITFQLTDLSFSIGIDSPLRWAFNHLFESGLKKGQDIIFPHGPLAFFIYPLQANLLFALLVTAVLQGGLIFGLFQLSKGYSNKEFLLPILISFLFLSLFGFYHLLLTNLVLCYLNYDITRKNYFKYLALLLTAFACYVKISLAMLSIAITASFLLLEFLREKQWQTILKDIAISFSFVLLFWFLMYQSISGIFTYFYGMVNLALSNSSAVAIYPDNNWLLIFLFLANILVLPFMQKTREGTYFGSLFLLSIFLGWKHGMAQEDIFHSRSFFMYVFMLMTLFLIYNKKNVILNFIVLGIGLSAFYLNISHLPSYFPKNIEFLGIHNFVDFAGHYKSITEKADSDTRRNLESNKLPQHIINEIGNSPVDVYPWDLSIIPANGLNWSPRPVIQSFVSYTSWLDKRNASHFSSESAPEYIIWDLMKETPDINGGTTESLDNRYLLNDEPNTMISVISNYLPSYKDNSFLVLRQREINVPFESEVSEQYISHWGKWEDLPDYQGDLLRARVSVRKNLPGKILSFLYQDESVSIYYKLANGEIFKYRFIPNNSADGIWLDPYIFRMQSGTYYSPVDSIMFMCSNRNLVKRKIKIEWEEINFQDNSDSTIYSFFGQETALPSSSLLHDTLSSNGNRRFWKNITGDEFLPTKGRKNMVYRVKPGKFSPTFSMNVSTLEADSVTIKTGFWYSGLKEDIPFVISLGTMENGTIIWHSTNLSSQIIDEKAWNHCYHYLDYDLSGLPENTELGIYLINESPEDLLMDQFYVEISGTSSSVFTR